MKIYRAIFTLLLIFNSAFALSESKGLSSGNHSVYKDHFGIVDAVYPDKSRMVVSDRSLNYTHGTSFLNAQGRKVAKIKEVISPGVAVKYHYYQRSSELILKDIRVVSMNELNKARKTSLQLF